MEDARHSGEMGFERGDLSMGSPLVTVFLLIVWAVLVGLDQARGWWLGRHPHASPRWLPAVRVAVGETVFDEALAQLSILHSDDPSYRIERPHLANAVQVACNAMRKGRQRAERVDLNDTARQV